MKTMGIVLVALLGAQAIKMRDLGDLDLPPLRDENDISQDKKILAQTESIDKNSAQDTDLIATFERQLDQGLRNAN